MLVMFFRTTRHSPIAYRDDNAGGGYSPDLEDCGGVTTAPPDVVSRPTAATSSVTGETSRTTSAISGSGAPGRGGGGIDSAITAATSSGTGETSRTTSAVPVSGAPGRGGGGSGSATTAATCSIIGETSCTTSAVPVSGAPGRGGGGSGSATTAATGDNTTVGQVNGTLLSAPIPTGLFALASPSIARRPVNAAPVPKKSRVSLSQDDDFDDLPLAQVPAAPRGAQPPAPPAPPAAAPRSSSRLHEAQRNQKAFSLDTYDHTDHLAHHNTRNFAAAQLAFQVEYCTPQVVSRYKPDTLSKKVRLVVTDLRSNREVPCEIILSAPPSPSHSHVDIEKFDLGSYSTTSSKLSRMELRILSCLDEYYWRRNVNIAIIEDIGYRGKRKVSATRVMRNYLSLELGETVGSLVYIRLDGIMK